MGRIREKEKGRKWFIKTIFYFFKGNNNKYLYLYYVL